MKNDVNDNKLSLVPLVFLLLGSVIGAGFSNLPTDMSKAASAGSILIGWLITGVGMFALALVFQNLSMRKPQLDSGVFNYARAGFGDYIGFNSAWGYWISAVCANVSFFVIIFNAMAYFFPSIFEKDHLTIWALIGGSAIIWAIQWLISIGVKQAAGANIVVQIAKLIPILLFIVVMIFVFNFDKFSFDFFGKGADLGSIGAQVRSTMLVTVWVFIGIEGAVVVSERAKSRKDIGRATIIALASTLFIYILISLLSLGYMSGQEIANLPTPSTAYILEQAVGPWGAAVINIGLVVSILGALLGWTILGMEVIYVGAKQGMIPKIFARENKHESPVAALLLTNGLQQALLVISYFAAAAYQALYSISTTAILIPYLLSGMYALKLAITGETYEQNPEHRRKDLIISGVCTIYAIWLIFAAGLKFLLLASILYAFGIFIYRWVQKENNRKLFSGPVDVIVFAVITLMAVVAVVMLVMGKIQI